MQHRGEVPVHLEGDMGRWGWPCTANVRNVTAYKHTQTLQRGELPNHQNPTSEMCTARRLPEGIARFPSYHTHGNRRGYGYAVGWTE